MRHSPYPADWQKRRMNVFRRDDHQCLNCGYRSPLEDEKSRGLHAHHKTKISNGGSHGLDNLATVCRDCHIEIHSNKGIDEVDRSRFEECAYHGCDEIRAKHALHQGGYCTGHCEYRDKGEKALGELLEEETFCSSCFSNWPPDEETCPSCGNWAPDEESAFQDGEVDKGNLAAHVVWKADVMGLFRD